MEFLESSRAPAEILEGPGGFDGPPCDSWRVPGCPRGHRRVAGEFQGPLESHRRAPGEFKLLPGECNLEELVIYNLNLVGGVG